MGTFLAVITYIVYIVFWWRLISHALVWCRMTDQLNIQPAPAAKITPSLIAISAIDLLLFRRLFNTNKLVWVGSWTFHVSLLLVIIRHLRYFLDPVPGWVVCAQPFGIFSGYVFAASLFYVLVLRITVKSQGYVSWQNMFLLAVLFLSSISGVLLRAIFRTDVIQAKAFILGILSLKPEANLGGPLFIMHFVLFLLLLLFLPLHIFAAPFVFVEARRRDEGLAMVMHER